jgi:hypothetical protein
MAGSGSRAQSADVLMFVRMRAGLRVSDSSPTRGQRVRFSGLVRPGHAALVVHIQKRNPDGTFRNVAKTFLVAGSASSSHYSGVIRVYRNGRYRCSSRATPTTSRRSAGCGCCALPRR